MSEVDQEKYMTHSFNVQESNDVFSYIKKYVMVLPLTSNKKKKKDIIIPITS